MKDYILWEKQPAQKFEDAHLLGNGRLGMSVLGGAPIEEILLNDDTLWSGSEGFYLNPQHYEKLAQARKCALSGNVKEANNIINEDMEGRWFETFLPMASLYLTIGQKNNRRNMSLKQVLTPEGEPFENYRRQLNLSDAVESVSYELDGVRYRREYFVSKPCNAGFIYCTAAKDSDSPEKSGGPAAENCLNLAMAIESKLRTVNGAADSEVYLTGIAPDHAEPSYTPVTPRCLYKNPEESEALRFACCARVIACDGTVFSDGSRVYVNDASYALIAVKAGTNYAGFLQERNKDVSALLKRLREELDELQSVAGALRREACAAFKKEHLADYQALYSRMNLKLGPDYTAALPTSERLQLCARGVDDPSVSALLLQYSRYRTIAGSRPGSQAMNLQGIWNDMMDPPWCSNYTNDINIEMNYWPSEVLGLPECHLPMMDLLKELSISGQQTAREYYHQDGWVTHHNTDLWRATEPSCEDASWSWWPFGGAWMCQHIWTHYEYTKDEAFLREMYPVLKGAARFMLEFLVENEEGYLVTAPSLSPENKFITGGEETVAELVEEIATGSRCSPNQPNISAVTVASTMDMSILRELFSNVAEAEKILHIEEDGIGSAAMEAVRRFPPYRTGRYGQLLEWYEDYEECTPGMGHISHMYPVFPGNVITQESEPALMKAAQRSLQRRMLNSGRNGGWPGAWKIALMARFKDSLTCGQIIKQMGPGLASSMLTKNSQQIDAIFGLGAGIAEMLLQSHQGYIEIIPAITVDWAAGSFYGMRARGGFEVSASWNRASLTDASIKSLCGQPCRVKAEGLIKAIGPDGTEYPAANGLAEFETTAGSQYRLIFA